MHTIHDFIRFHALRTPDRKAIEGIQRKPLTYSMLLQQIEETSYRINAVGLEKKNRIAIVLPEGPEMTTVFLAVGCSAVAAPLNPAYQLDEFICYLSNLGISALITMPDFCPQAVQAAFHLNLKILYLTFSSKSPAGIFELSAPSISGGKLTKLSSPEDLMLVSHTSGTTARPKIVPLTHNNICSSARNIIRSLALTAEDRCLNVMPLFHIHGSIICAVSSLVAGATVIAAPRYNAPLFLTWLQDTCPTWYSAAPSIHQSVLDQAEKRPELLQGHSLRLIRSSASAMPVSLLEKMEQTFQVPFIEGYGLSETAHLLTSNFLPPFVRKPGSVGIAAGPEVAIMDTESSRLLKPFETGEIVARGENVMSGYENNPQANQKAFCDGWFRTGDQGYFDHEGYFYVTGRLKEIINRGGEKIAPREIDEALLKHPDVREAVAFAIPDERLGEEVAAAVVLYENIIDEISLKRYLEDQLAHFKIPSRILILDAIPKSAPGKIQRSGLAETLGFCQKSHDGGESTRIPPQTALEMKIAKVWEEVLHQTGIGGNQSFISLGGDSILAGELVIRLKEILNIELSLIDLFDAPTISDQAKLVEGTAIYDADNS